MKFHAHRLRHTFATLIASRVSVFDLKDLLGYTPVSTTQIYVQQNMEHLAEVHRGNSPLLMLAINQTIKRARGSPRSSRIYASSGVIFLPRFFLNKYKPKSYSFKKSKIKRLTLDGSSCWTQ